MKLSVLRWIAFSCLASWLGAASAFAGAKQLWSAKLPGDAKWHSLTGLGTLIVGTSDAILAYNPDTGEPLWSRNEFKKSSPFNAKEIPGTPFLLCNTSGGLGNIKVKLFQIDYLTGKTVWETPEMTGQYMGTIPVVEKGLILFLINGANAEGKEPGTYIHAFDFDGKPKWVTRFAKTGAVQMHLADNSGKFFMTSDLSGYHDPLVEGCIDRIHG